CRTRRWRRALLSELREGRRLLHLPELRARIRAGQPRPDRDGLLNPDAPRSDRERADPGQEQGARPFGPAQRAPDRPTGPAGVSLAFAPRVYLDRAGSRGIQSRDPGRHAPRVDGMPSLTDDDRLGRTDDRPAHTGLTPSNTVN